MDRSQKAPLGHVAPRFIKSWRATSNHLVRARRATDLEVLDALVRGASAKAREVLDKFRDNHAFDPDRVLATELHIALDEDFRPVSDLAGCGDAREERHTQGAAYEGTLDLVLLNSITEAEIDDWKSYYQVIDADTFQSKFYPLLLMCLNPSLERVKLVLEFVRYGVSRCVEYTRADLPPDSREGHFELREEPPRGN